MLEFRLNNEPIIVDRDTSVKMRWVNPACKFDEIPSDVGLGVEIGVNEYTRRTFGNPERFEKHNAGTNREYPGFEIRFSGMLLHSGTYIITNATKESYSGWVRGNVGTLGKAEREKFINEAECFSSMFEFIPKATYAPETDNYCCPVIINNDFFADTGKEITYNKLVPNPTPTTPFDLYIVEQFQGNILSYWFKETTEDGYVNFRSPVDGKVLSVQQMVKITDLTIADNSKVTAVTPMFYLNYVIEELFKSFGFFISANFLETHSSFKGLCIYNNYDITRNEPIMTDIMVLWEYSDNGNVQEYRSIGKKLTHVQRIPGWLAPTYAKNHLPKMKLKDFVLGIQNLTNVCFFFKRDNTVDIIDREGILTGTSFDIDKYFLGEWELGEKKNVALKFVMEHDNDDMIFSERFTDLSDRKADILEPVETWDDLALLDDPQSGDIRYIKGSRVYAEYKWTVKTETDPDTEADVSTDLLGWEEISIGFQPGFYNYGAEEEEEINTKFSTVATKVNGLASIPQVRQKGNTHYNNDAFSNFSPRLMFNTGFFTLLQSLDWEQIFEFFQTDPEIGLINTRWKTWARFWAHRLPVTGSFQLPLNILYYMINNITGKFRARHGEIVIEEMETEFRGNMIGPTVIRGYKVE